MTGPTISILVVDDHPIIRTGLKALLANQADFRIAGEAGDGHEALQLIDVTAPDVVVTDITMPSLNGLDMTREIRRRAPQTRVIVLSMHVNEAFAQEALRSGAHAYVVKDSSPTELIHAIREAMAGRRFISEGIDQRTIDRFVDLDLDGLRSPHETLTAREREVFQLVAEGETNAEIGKRLFISPRTVEIHRAAVMRKLGVKNHIELVAYAMKRGIIAA